MELMLGEKKYRTGRLDTMKQSHVARRLMPVVATMGKAARDILINSPKPLPPAATEGAPPPAVDGTIPEDGLEEKMGDDLMFGMGEAAANIIAKMPDNDWDYILNSCLHTVERQEGQGWTPIMSGARLRYDDIDLPTMTQLVFTVIRENLGNFFQGPRTQP